MLFIARRTAVLLRNVQTRLLATQSHHGIYDPKTHVVKTPYQAELPNVSIPEYVWRDVKKWESKPALTCVATGKSFTYGQTYAACQNLSVNLPPLLGLKAGDVVGLVLPNMPEYAFAFYGCLSAGLVVSPANPVYTADELAKQFKDAKVRAVITTPQLLERVRAGLEMTPSAGAPIILTEGQTSKDVIALQDLTSRRNKGAVTPERPDPESLAVLPYSSGTTGVPKGVVINHRNMVTGLCIGNHRDAVSYGVEDGQQNSTIAVIPFYHIYGSVIIIGLCLNRGYHIITMPKFEPEVFTKTFSKYKPTHMFLVPPLTLFMARSPAITKEDMANLKLALCGAAPLTKQIMDEFMAKASPRMIFKSGYGMTESTCLISTMPEEMEECKTKSMGPPGSFTEVKITDDAGSALPLGQVGELCVRGPQIVQGYLNNEKATKETISEDGWLKTGDVALLDKYGHINIVDRVKELIKVKGYQVSPTEIENVLIKMDGVADIAVVGIPDEKAGELPKAYIVRNAGSKISAEDVAEYLKPKVAEFKQLKGGIKFIDAIPKSAAGKILRKDLKNL